MHIAIIGPVGLGKSTLAQSLASRFQIKLLEEPWEQNEYIPHLPLHVFSCQYKQLNIMREHGAKALKIAKKEPVISDRIYQESFDVFCRQYRHLLTAEEWAGLELLDAAIGSSVALPDIVLHLQAAPEVALSRIKKRGRDFELDKITLSYCREQDLLYRGLASKLAERTQVFTLDAAHEPEKVVTQALRATKLTALLKGE